MAESEALQSVSRLIAEGRFSAALKTLNQLPLLKSRTPAGDTLRLILLERTGRYREAEHLAERLLRNRSLTRSQRSVCAFSMGMLLWECGQTEDAIEQFEKSVKLAQSEEDYEQACWALLRHFVSTAGRSSEASVARLFRQLRYNIVRLGNPTVRAALHILVGEVEAKRGLSAVARRHTEIGVSLLKRAPNVWLQCLAENNYAALALMRFDTDEALRHLQTSLLLANESGAAAAARAALSNLGLVHHLRGNYATARDTISRAHEVLPSSGEYGNAGLDALARTYLAEGDFGSADALLNRIELGLKSEADRRLYPNRYALLTRIEWLIHTGDWLRAQEKASQLHVIVDEVEDRHLKMLALARSAHVTALTAGAPQAVQPLAEFYALAPDSSSPEHLAEYELTLASILEHEGACGAECHRRRAKRIYAGLRGEAQPHRAANLASSQTASFVVPARRLGEIVQDIAATLLCAGRPELVALGILATIENTDCAVGARAISRAADGSEAVLDSFGTIDGQTPARTFPVGTTPERTVEVQIHARPDIESNATISSVGLIIHTARELDRARLDREERLTLWPVEELPAEDDDSVVSGTMSAVMLAARKIADTRCAVLITGESGTGKELVARAVHRYSSRALKPFIPFNCTAVPRDLMESHLFGYRRGAFTGADRDNPGLIRSAQGGTLFLDEVGDLSLELQPKLLRFLESTEIHPLGDGVPFPVNVRIVAATNANLRQLVEQGRFREDLYYRLNVFPIELPPLRKRREEIAPLAQTFALKWSHELGKGCVRIAPDLMAHFELYSWPGNIRQLNHEVNRLMATAEPNQDLTADMLSPQMRDETEQAKRKASGLEMTISLTDPLEATIARIEEEMIRIALTRNHGKVEAAAKALGISRKGLYLKRQRLGL